MSLRIGKKQNEIKRQKASGFFVFSVMIMAGFFLFANSKSALAIDGIMNGKTITGETDNYLLWLQTYDPATSPYFFDKFFIDKAGSVGIGTSNPQGRLQITGTSGSVAGSGLVFNGNTAIWQPSDSSLTIRPAGTDIATFLSTGVGVGTAVPNDTFSIGNSGAAPAGSPKTGHNFTSTYLATDDYALVNYGLMKTVMSGGSNSLWSGAKDGTIWNGTSGAGNVGIGTTVPRSSLSVIGSAGRIDIAKSYSDTATGATVPSRANMYMIVGGQEYNNGTYRGIGFGYNMASHVNVPAYIASIDRGVAGYTHSDLVFATRNVDTDTQATERMIIRSDGNIGIGITNPVGKLQVAGTSTYNSDTVKALRVSDGTTITKAVDIGFDAALDRGFIQAGNFGTAYKDLLLNPNMGNVGIGTTNPANRFDVATTVNGQGLQISPAAGTYAIVGFGGGVSAGAANAMFYSDTNYLAINSKAGSKLYLNFDNANASSDVDFFNGKVVVKQSGNVGIGTTAPNDKLSIGNSGAAPAGSANTGHNFTSTYLATDDYALTNYGVVKTLIANATSTMPTGANFWGGTLNSNIWNGAAGAGNVGIGTTNPVYKLDVAGLARFAPPALTYGAIEVGGYYNPTTPWTSKIVGDYYGLQYNANIYHGMSFIGGRAGFDNFRWFTSAYAENMTLFNSGNLSLGYGTNPTDNGNRLQVSGNANFSGNVGIGTTAPGTKLSFGNSVANSPLFLSTYGEFSGIGMDQSTAGLRLVGDTTSNNPLVDIGYYNGAVQHANWVSRMMVRQGGNVGIGTAGPAQKLDIYSATGGGVTLRSDGVSGTFPIVNAMGFGPSTVSYNYASNGGTLNVFGGAQIAAIQTQASGAETHLAFYTTTGGGVTERMRILNNGNVGINTTAPNDKFSIGNAGTAPAGSAATGHNYTSTYLATDDYALVNYGLMKTVLVGGSSALWSGAKDGTIWNGTSGAGNVGIGTTAPSEKLQVAGDIALNGNAFSSKIIVNPTSGPGWYRIAVNGGNGGGTVYTNASIDNTIQRLEFNYNTRSYVGANEQIGTINILRTQNYNNGPITKIRIGADSGPVIWNSYLDIYISTATAPVAFTIYGTNGATFLASPTFNPAVPPYVQTVDLADTSMRGMSTSQNFEVGANAFVLGNVGVGTTNPGQKLEVVGHVRANGVYETYGGGALKGDFGPYNTIYGSGPTDPTIYSATGNFLIANANVGIGTTNPGKKLEVTGDITTSALNNYVYARYAAGNDSYISGFGFNSAVGGVLQLGNNALNEIRAGTTGTGGYLNFVVNNTALPSAVNNGTTAMSIIASGNVGINTTSPNDTFSIGNTGSAPAGSSKTGHNFTSTYLSTDDYALVNYGLMKTVMSGGSNSLWSGAKDGTIWNGTSGAGNVGIGTSAPSVRLDVQGNGNLYGTNIYGTWTPDGNSLIRNWALNDGSNNYNTVSGAGGTYTSVTDAPMGSKTMRYSANTYFRNGQWIPVDITRTYKVSVWGRTISGTPNNYLSLTQATSDLSQPSNGGWGNPYWGVVNQPFPAAWTYYTMTIGPAGSGADNTWTSTTRYVQLGALMIYTGSGVCELTGYKIEEVPNTIAAGTTGLGNLIVNGNIGVGINNPLRKLVVQGVDDGNVQLRLQGTGDAASYWELGRESASTGDFRLISNRTGTGVITALSVKDTTGNVGIGALSPRSRLEVTVGAANTNADVAGIAGNFTAATQTGQSSTLSLESNDAVAADTGGILGFGGRYSGTAYANWASIKGLKADATGGNYGGYMSFWTRQTGAGSVERMRITDTGNIGINTSAPLDKLSIGNAGAAPAGSANTGHNFTSTYLATDDYALANYGVVKTMVAGSSASQGIKLLSSGTGMVLSGNTVTRVGGGGWDGQAYSQDGYSGGAYTSFVINSLGHSYMAGLNTDPTLDASYCSLDYAWYVTTSNNGYIYESCGNPVAGITLAVGDVLAVVYDGTNVKYLQNGVVRRTVAANIAGPLYFDSSFVTGAVGSTISNIQFGPAGGGGGVAQWTTNGTDIYNANSGNVGIGTASPQASFKLDINGQSVTRGDMYVNGNLIEFGSNGFQLSKSGNSWSNGGNFGIGTTAPGSKFSILKNSTVNNENEGGMEIASGIANTNAKLIFGTVGDSYSYLQSMQQDYDWSTRPLVFQPNAGNVGIGTISPGFKLDVLGNIHLRALNSTLEMGNGDSNATYGSIGFNNTSNDVEIKQKYAAGGIRLFTNTSSERLTILSSGNVGINNSSPNDAFSIGNAGTAPVGSANTGHNFTSTYLATDDYALANYGVVKTLVASSISSTLNQKRYDLTPFSYDGTMHYYWNKIAHLDGGYAHLALRAVSQQNTDGNAGQTINEITVTLNGAVNAVRVTNIPIASNRYSGVNISVAVDTNRDVWLYSAVSWAPWFYYILDDARAVTPYSTITTQEAAPSTAIVNDNETKNITFSTGVVNQSSVVGLANYDNVNYGLGITNPSSSLHIFGASGAATEYLKFSSSDGGDIRFGKASGVNNDAIIGTWTNNSLQFFTNTGERMRIESGGNVGIGTSAPTNPLSVLWGAANTAGDSLTTATAQVTGPNWAMDGAASNATFLVATNNAAAIGNGGSIGFAGRYSGTSQATFSAIKGASENGSYDGYLAFGTRTGAQILERMRINGAGNVGIGTTAPNDRFSIGNAGTAPAGSANTGHNYTSTYLATDNYALVNYGILKTMTINAGNATTITSGGDLNMGGFNILAVNKLTVNTIDPLYDINGVKYSTYAASISGGVKEEVVGKVVINSRAANNEYEAVIDFAKEKEGTNLWVWRQVIDYSSENVEVFMTPFGKFANTYYSIENNKLIFRSDRPVTISYRLIGNRFDWRKWPTRALDQSEKGMKVE